MLKKISIYSLIIFMWAVTLYASPLKNVIIISIDAFHPAPINAKTTPTIYIEMRDGAYTLEGYSTNPPKTLVAHTAMFTGTTPDESEKLDNQWQTGEPTINRETIFNIAKLYGFSTGYYYSKQKLGYLVNDAVDFHQLSRDDSIYLADAFIRKAGRHFVFLHVSGLDFAGPEYGWLSPEYIEELSYIDEYLTLLINFIKSQKNYFLDFARVGGFHMLRY